MMRVAGYLHDLGKLAVPREILEKPGRLTPEEFAVIRSHTYHTYRILEPLQDLQVINRWASYHHERLDGKGYPFHLTADSLDLDSRIIAVADVFTAVTEDRPYRKVMDRKRALGVLEDMAGHSLDAGVIAQLVANFDLVSSSRKASEVATMAEYDRVA